MAKTTGWRRIAVATWSWPKDPQIYGRIEVDAEPVLEAIEKVRSQTGTKVTVTHFVARGIALALAAAPSINTRLSFGRFRPRSSVDVFVIVSTGAGKDLSGVKIKEADRKGIVEVAAETARGSRATRGGERTELEQGKKLLTALPPRALKMVLRAAAFVTSDLGISLRRFGLPREAFGGAMVTSVGMFGISEGLAPLSPIYRVPLLVLVGEVERKPWVVGDRVEPRHVLTVTATIDHRWVDGYGLAALSRTFRAYLADPLAYEKLDAAGG